MVVFSRMLETARPYRCVSGHHGRLTDLIRGMWGFSLTDFPAKGAERQH